MNCKICKKELTNESKFCDKCSLDKLKNNVIKTGSYVSSIG